MLLQYVYTQFLHLLFGAPLDQLVSVGVPKACLEHIPKSVKRFSGCASKQKIIERRSDPFRSKRALTGVFPTVLPLSGGVRL
ncbi:hypothetical protein FIB18_05045 [Brucella pecoris]|uniref:Uncharacterized protein n=1 Tax=Brucella pecoris TaxID=867683 RepID=A0A5C5CU87_9HYPH|nr:hypothetical protein FIB18_05045 [Brucella pecoris]